MNLIGKKEPSSDRVEESVLKNKGEAPPSITLPSETVNDHLKTNIIKSSNGWHWRLFPNFFWAKAKLIFEKKRVRRVEQNGTFVLLILRYVLPLLLNCHKLASWREQILTLYLLSILVCIVKKKVC